STPFNVSSPGTPAYVYFSQNLNDVTAGTVIPAFNAVIYDTMGSPVTNATGTIAVSITSGPAGAVLSGTLSKPAVNGVATFDDLVLTKGGGYQFALSSPGLASSVSNGFGVGDA